MEKIKIKSFENLILKIALIMAPIVQLFTGVSAYLVTNDEYGMYILLFMALIALLQIPAVILLNKRFSSIRDYFIEGNEIMRNGIVLFNKREVVSITKISLLKTDINYIKDEQEYKISVFIPNKKLKEVKALFGIYE
jgi:hypothetical protein